MAALHQQKDSPLSRAFLRLFELRRAGALAQMASTEGNQLYRAQASYNNFDKLIRDVLTGPRVARATQRGE